MKVLSMILGALVIFGGVQCMMDPTQTFAALGWIIGFSMIVEGLGRAFSWGTYKMLGFADGWTLAGAVFSVMLGAAVVGSEYLQFAINEFLAYIVAFWLLTSGFARIFGSFTLLGARRDGLPVGQHWFLLFLIGVIVTAIGCFCLFHPLVTMASVGMLMGAGIVSTGCSLIFAALLM